MAVYTPKVKAHTVNITVYRWPCTYCGNKNTTLETEIIPNKENSDTRLAACNRCKTVSEIEHHTFKKVKS